MTCYPLTHEELEVHNQNSPLPPVVMETKSTAATHVHIIIYYLMGEKAIWLDIA